MDEQILFLCLINLQQFLMIHKIVFQKLMTFILLIHNARQNHE